jgi:hypothetical protein
MEEARREEEGESSERKGREQGDRKHALEPVAFTATSRHIRPPMRAHKEHTI